MLIAMLILFVGFVVMALQNPGVELLPLIADVGVGVGVADYRAPGPAAAG